MIITISGTPGSGKSTVAKIIARKLKFEHYSTGDFMRQLAEENKMNILEFSKQAEKDRSIDEELDQRQINLGREKDDFVIDGRLSWHFIPKAIKVFIDADFNKRAERIFHDHIRKEHNVTLETSKKKLKEREQSEIKRYKRYYNINPYDKKNFDLVADSTDKDQEEIAAEVIEFVKKRE